MNGWELMEDEWMGVDWGMNGWKLMEDEWMRVDEG